MELGTLESSYLDLLNSNADPMQLYHLCDHLDLAGEETDICSEPDKDTINCEQLHGLFCDIEDDEETREAYNSIADLDSYIFQDAQPDSWSRDAFSKHMGVEDSAGDSGKALEEAGQRGPKRSCPEEVLPADPKHRKLVPELLPQPPLVPPGLLSEEPAFRQSPPEAVLVPVLPLPTDSPTTCLHLQAGPLQLIPTQPQTFWQISGTGAGTPILIYQSQMPQAGRKAPPCTPGIQSLPESPGRPGSTSPFAPSASDLPGLPEPTLTSQAPTAAVASPEDAATRSPGPAEASKPPTWSESVERFQRSLRDKYQAEPLGPEGFLVEVDLVRARLERSSIKSQERELAILDWTERQPARGGLAAILLAPGARRRPQDTQVIAALGKAGQGKSLWVRSVARAWASGQLPQFDFVFLLRGHCLDRLGDPCRLQDLLSLAASQPLDAEVLDHVVKRPHRVLLIWDAFEELEAQDGPPHGASGHAWTEPCSPRVLLAGLFQRKLLRGCTMLLAARPRGRLALSLSKADALFEVAGFSARQAEAYVRRHWAHRDRPELQDEALRLLHAHPFLLGHCRIPAACQAVCRLAETLVGQAEGAPLPSTLTGLYVGLLGPAVRGSPPGALEELARLAWELGRQHHSTLRAEQLPSAELRAWAGAAGLLQPVPGSHEAELAFPSLLMQCFLAAVWLARSPHVKDKELPQYLALTPRKKRPYDNWLEAVPRFLAGLVFQPPAHGLAALVGPVAATVSGRKQKMLSRYLKRLQPGLLPAGRLLELLHCAHEAEDPGLWEHALHGLPAHLGFPGTRLAPPDVHVLARALKAAGRDFTLDIRSTGIDPPGLATLVGLSCVSCVRAALSDAVALWRSLRQQGQTGLLRAAEDKFTIEPFKVESPKDVEDLIDLVQLQRARGTPGDAEPGELPAVRGLRKLEFALGPVRGPQAFPRLVGILEAFSSLRYLDLDSLSENKIGDDGVTLLSAAFPRLKALETLNLSQNSITDVGACKLAEALPALAASLLRLSLYNNCICDKGAQSLAHVLPEMGTLQELDVQYNKFTASGAQQLAASLKKSPQVKRLALWTPTIPFGVHEHLQLLDSRISLR
ncbi:MHC class II transactivator [Sorex fumeus]|uniref:MHC class II transactivator n=1 Tax=Sorex fumeus TaxID=62283 RepID=UPI0024ACA6C6|nr:MHC class II transactivator [Sorex fumeus]